MPVWANPENMKRRVTAGLVRGEIASNALVFVSESPGGSFELSFKQNEHQLRSQST